MDQPAPQGRDHCLGAIVNFQPHENSANMTFHGGFRDPQ